MSEEVKQAPSKKKRIIKIVAIALAALFGFLLLLVGGYVAYVTAQYYRIEDHTALEISNGQTQTVQAGTQYSLLTYNLGFAAYSPEYSFFMDTGVMKDGKKVQGKYGKGMNKKDVQKNVDGQISVVQSLNTDFCFLQEVDTNSDRSYHINMHESIAGAMTEYSSTLAMNFHTAKLLYPFNDPIGKSNSGIMTLSKYQIKSAERRAFPLTDNFIDKLFDLDRCFSVHRLPIEGSAHELVLINLHMSAYDEGGKVRAQQLEMLNAVLEQEYADGNYVIAGGDFNHCLIAKFCDNDKVAAQSYFACQQEIPDWVKGSVLLESELAGGYSIKAPMNHPTCRGADIPYEAGVNYETVIDGFIVSNNITALDSDVITVEQPGGYYRFSDHNPVKLTFTLN